MGGRQYSIGIPDNAVQVEFRLVNLTVIELPKSKLRLNFSLALFECGFENEDCQGYDDGWRQWLKESSSEDATGNFSL